MIRIRKAERRQASEIARLIMMAMTDECCLHFCGAGHGLKDFHRMMSELVGRTDTQYSFENTLVAMDGERLAGIAVAYDGGRLHELRRAFIDASFQQLGKDNSDIDDETQAGELYLDSLAVIPEYRRQGIALRLIEACRQRATEMGLPHLGLLVDKGNPSGEALYAAAGFRYAGDSQWGGHPMSHLVL